MHICSLYVFKCTRLYECRYNLRRYSAVGSLVNGIWRLHESLQHLMLSESSRRPVQLLSTAVCGTMTKFYSRYILALLCYRTTLGARTTSISIWLFPFQYCTSTSRAHEGNLDLIRSLSSGYLAEGCSGR